MAWHWKTDLRGGKETEGAAIGGGDGTAGGDGGGGAISSDCGAGSARHRQWCASTVSGDGDACGETEVTCGAGHCRRQYRRRCGASGQCARKDIMRRRRYQRSMRRRRYHSGYSYFGSRLHNLVSYNWSGVPWPMDAGHPTQGQTLFFWQQLWHSPIPVSARATRY